MYQCSAALKFTSGLFTCAVSFDYVLCPEHVILYIFFANTNCFGRTNKQKSHHIVKYWTSQRVTERHIVVCVDHVLLFYICFEGKLLILISNGLCFCITFMFRGSVVLYPVLDHAMVPGNNR